MVVWVPAAALSMVIDWFAMCLTVTVPAGFAVDARLMAMLVVASMVQPEARCSRNNYESRSPLESRAHVMSNIYISNLV
jgi:hypothetical protein